MNLWDAFWNDESGMILSAEAALLGTVGIIGATVGLSAAARSINDELTEVAYAFRGLDQSYSFDGVRSENAWTAGSSYKQPPVAESQQKLREQIEQQERELKRRERELERDEKKHRKNRKRDRNRASIPLETDWTIDGVTASN